jgi:predicted DNA binding CopG/RHH family protein
MKKTKRKQHLIAKTESTKAVQLFRSEDLPSKLSSTEIAEFLDAFRNLNFSVGKGQAILISIKIPEDLLLTFKWKSQSEGVKYQSKIKELMRQYVLEVSL